MQPSEFDRFADEYHSVHAQNIRLSGEDPAYFARYKARMAALLARAGLPVPSLLDFGTGVGNSLPFLHEEFPACRLTGVDVSRRSLDVARERFGDIAELIEFDGSHLPGTDGGFGLALAACVFHHIDHAEHVAKLAEIRRVLAPGGWLLVFEHNPWNPLTRKAVRECPFDENARLMTAGVLRARARAAGFTSAEIRYCVFFPAALAWLRPLERWLGWLPLGAQYCIACRR
jgi:ubiquinone/menaquinone biosynthesis C-methylase UbiE